MLGAGKVVRIGGFNLSTLSSSILGIRQGGVNTLIKSLFSLGEQGFAFDPSDLSTLYQDAAGTIPVTAAGQPVGLMKDKSGRNNHAFQAVSASRPLLRKDEITAHNYLEFDGVDDFMQLVSISIAAPFSTMHCIESISGVASSQALLSSGAVGYLYISAHASVGVQQSVGDPQMSLLRNKADTIYHKSDDFGVLIKTNNTSSVRTDLVAKNPFALPNKFLGRFSASSGTAASMKYYGGLLIGRSMTESEELALRNSFNKRLGVYQ